MKKKLISFLLVCCMMFPCFFAVACKKNNKEKKPEAKSYTYSVVLKNAEGKINENTLVEEYDFSKDKNIAWEKSDKDYKISVSKKGSSDGGLYIHLLEGFDYSNLTLKVNDKDEKFDVVSGDKKECLSESYLTNRQFQYLYKEMNDDTEIVVDFSNCVWSKITIDVSNLRKNNINYFQVQDDFVTIDMASNLALTEFKTFETDEITVDYGTIFAFDYSEQLAFDTENKGTLEKLGYSTYGSKYFISKNRVQYLTAKRNGSCEVYYVTEDAKNNGTIRVLSTGGMSFASALSDFDTNNYVQLNEEKERFDGEVLTLSVFKGNQLFVNLNSSAQEFEYFLVDNIDDDWIDLYKVEQITSEDGRYVYLNINISNNEGSDVPAKYLVRKPKLENNFIAIFIDELPENTRFINTDCILVGLSNKPINAPSSVSDTIYYCYKKGKQADISITGLMSDKRTDYTQTNNEVLITGENLLDNGLVSRSISAVNANPLDVATVLVDVYSDTDENNIYELKIRYLTNTFTESIVQLDYSDLFLYEGEKAYYTSDILNNDSWKELSGDDLIEISSGIGKTIYYYVDSNRIDSTLNITNSLGEIVSATGNLRDCFGRNLVGTIKTGDVTIDLSRVCYLDIIPGYYDSYTAKISREFDKTYHEIDLSSVEENLDLMVSFTNYSDQNSYTNINDLNQFKIKYDGYNTKGVIYYYLKNTANKLITLKNSDGVVVSHSELIEEKTGAFQIDGYYVYRLSLLGNYYQSGEKFVISVEDAKYSIVDNATSNKMIIYIDNGAHNSTEEIVIGNTYYFVYDGDNSTRFKIVDDNGKELVGGDEIVFIKSMANHQALFSFTINFDENENYAPKTAFKLIKIQ